MWKKQFPHPRQVAPAILNMPPSPDTERVSGSGGQLTPGPRDLPVLSPTHPCEVRPGSSCLPETLGSTARSCAPLPQGLAPRQAMTEEP